MGSAKIGVKYISVCVMSVEKLVALLAKWFDEILAVEPHHIRIMMRLVELVGIVNLVEGFHACLYDIRVEIELIRTSFLTVRV
jgi:hypothetical protein